MNSCNRGASTSNLPCGVYLLGTPDNLCGWLVLCVYVIWCDLVCGGRNRKSGANENQVLWQRSWKADGGCRSAGGGVADDAAMR